MSCLNHPRQLFGVIEAASILGLSRSTMWRAVRANSIAAHSARWAKAHD